ncbi:AAA-domain-containing protein [Suhomyces tanzawaensis NRRL Y-17324]|uniref:AAA-domain-containing protein n=1 Tax=Suhomyces tanzawaensis NRRL Y-17324 TaxID=984487 RepID=A0A1E4SRW3_9ASCO|nr:AAA-domain-containing protein [Suhomyces tanzawaensis NRRL Y-17324]ODV82259.1 AAA-domain-containing protein [Suhomyces tanzawaensis NRRL Y-17324]
MANKRTVTQSIDQKIYDLIHDLLEAKSQEKASVVEESDDPYAKIASAKDLSGSQVLEYVQLKDFQLRRMKRNILDKAVSAVLKVVVEEEDEYFRSIKPIDSASGEDEEETEEKDLMEVKDSNALNKSVVSLWGNPDKTEKVDPPDSEELKDSERVEEGGEKKRTKNSTKQSIKKRKSKVDHQPPSSKLSSLGGLENVTTQLMELIGLPILHPEIYRSTGVEPPRGVLLYGPPGCGKTSIANALAGELQVPFISISAPSIVSGMSGESEKKLREIFEEAKTIAPCIIFMDEIDAITPKRDGGAQREMERRIVAQLLTLMDELTLEKTDGKPVIVIGATNRPDSLDSALRRAGRFDREICLNVPNEDQRCSILKSMTKNLKMQENLDFKFKELAKRTPGYVGADLKSLVTAAGIAAIKRIFESLSEQQQELLNGEMEKATGEIVNGDSMDIDTTVATSPNNTFVNNFKSKSDVEKYSTIQKFLLSHPQPLTEEQLAPLCISYDDFLTALPTIQPTAKREGFATVPDVSWQNVGALNHIRMELHMCIVQPIKKPEIYLKVGISAPAGVLMWGPPGCGKTLLAKAVANESRANFISIKGPELLNKYVGESERAVRQVFQRARASVPCIIFFDELDALVPRRDTSLSESSSRVVNTLLTELDGLNDRKGVFVIGATNRPDMIDPAMLRPGRLDKTLYIELPSNEERFEILQTLVAANKTPLSDEVDLKVVANDERCRNFSGADLSSLVREAGVLALKKKFFHGQQIKQLDASGYYEEESVDSDIVVTSKDFDLALSSINPSVSDKDRAKYEKLNKRMGWSVISETQEELASKPE